jgi:hypothetical protein
MGNIIASANARGGVAMTHFDPESRAAMKACGTGDHRGGAEGGRVSTVQYVGLVTLAGIWAVVSVLFILWRAPI